jgi:hypothetical protein
MLKKLRIIFHLPVFPLMLLYAMFSFIMFYKNDGIEFFMSKNLSDDLKGTKYEKFTKTYMMPFFKVCAVFAWYYIIKFFARG